MKEFKLDDHPKISPGFKVPENYFDNFSKKMMQQLVQPEVKIIPLAQNRKSWIFAAAAVLVLALILPALNQFGKTGTTTEPDQTQVENYLAYTQIPDEEIVALLDNEDIQSINVDFNLDESDIEDALSSETINENYIID
jgi:hypothetical protein